MDNADYSIARSSSNDNSGIICDNNIYTINGKTAEWVTIDNYRTKTVITENAIDKDEPDIEDRIYKSKLNHILYDGVVYKQREELLKVLFPEYKKFPLKVRFKNDDVFYLGSNQRSKLQYHILEQYILSQGLELVTVDENIKSDLERFCSNHKAETAQRWLNRMQWENGHEKMVSFGVAIDVKSVNNDDGSKTKKAKGIYCYSSIVTNTNAIFRGIETEWSEWSRGIINQLNIAKEYKGKKYKDRYEHYIDIAMQAIYYQNYKYLTLTGEADNKIKKWLYKYLNDSNVEFPFRGKIPNSNVAFTIDFQNDTEIVKQHDNTQHNQELGLKKVVNTFIGLVGDEWTTQEIYSQRFNKGNLERFVKYGLIERTKRGHYKRIMSAEAARTFAE